MSVKLKKKAYKKKKGRVGDLLVGRDEAGKQGLDFTSAESNLWNKSRNTRKGSYQTPASNQN